MSASESHEQQPVGEHPSKQPIVIVVMGVAGTGKTTLATALATRLRFASIEGDALHPPANVAKMSAGTPLTDADREPWLARLRAAAARAVAPPHGARGVLVTCSALRAYYRDILRGTRAVEGAGEEGEEEAGGEMARTPLPTYFVYIKGERPLLEQRIAGREGHYMKPNMLDSQLRTLESPEGEQGVVVVPLDATTDEQAEVALQELSNFVPDLL
ncbi:carbohydrate kinase [Epithele typhae]|uniref:carbohydrate kinase n=1 Tax=Epithele typhae TaxID=378194 RepID=UPI002008BC31|nr:carbohydrate kinase [Epithele typhae]KAH9942356.1 carbohydrate kinase [Epithele typhae]